MMTRADYIEECGSLDAAVQFEEQALAIGTEFLPLYVRENKGKMHIADSRYWSWLIDQWQASDKV